MFWKCKSWVSYYVFGVKKYNGDNGNILSSLHDLGNQGQIHFCLAFLISGYIHDPLDLGVDSNIPKVWDLKIIIKWIIWPKQLTLIIKVIHIMTWPCLCLNAIGCSTFYHTDNNALSLANWSPSWHPSTLALFREVWQAQPVLSSISQISKQ